MAIIEIKREQIYESFLGDNLNKVESFGIDVEVPETIEKAFGIEGLNKTIEATHSIAEWKMVIIESREIDEGVNRRFAFELAVGPRDQELRMIYFPYVPDDKTLFSAKQETNFLLMGGAQDILRQSTLRVIKRSEVNNGNIIFICEPSGRAKKQKVIIISPKDGLLAETELDEYKKEEEEVDNPQSSFI